MRHQATQTSRRTTRLPAWVPDEIWTYLAHVEDGTPLRQLAKTSGCHASTVMRQVRRTEDLRDDPLADAALKSLETLWHGRARPAAASQTGGPSMATTPSPQDGEKLERDVLRALRALIEPGALLVIAEGVEDAVVVVDNKEEDRPVRRAVVLRDVAESLALREWIAGEAKGRLARYRITPKGRGELNRLMAEAESRRATGAPADGDTARRAGAGGKKRRLAGAEPPVRVLARRKRGDGAPFLPPELVRAGERFRESYEIALAGGAIGEALEPLLNGDMTAPEPVMVGNTMQKPQPTARATTAHVSLSKAILALGPDLAETVLMACCQEIGMEDIEARLDFPARSGKIVLRIALSTLLRHYDRVGDEDHGMIY